MFPSRKGTALRLKQMSDKPFKFRVYKILYYFPPSKKLTKKKVQTIHVNKVSLKCQKYNSSPSLTQSPDGVREKS